MNITIPEGYKATTVGIIPVDWGVKKLGELCDTFKSGYGITSMDITEAGSFPVYGGNGLRGFTKSFTHDGNYFLIGRQGALCGNIVRIDGKSYVSEHAIAVQTNDENDLSFLAYKLDFRNLNNLSESSAQPGLSVEKLVKIKLSIPPLEEQERIAKAIETIDRAIYTVTKLIEKKELQKKALMQQLLTGKKRLKGFVDEWENVKLSKYTKKVKGKVCEVSVDGTGLPCITASSFNSNYTAFTNSTDSVYCYENDVLVLWDGENAGAVTTNHNGIIGSTVAKLILKRGMNNFFITYLLHFENQRLRAIREGSGIPHMPGDFEDWFHFRLPSIEEQTAIAQILQTADKEIQQLKAKADKLREQKKGMTQVLLTGKKRLKIKDIKV